MLQFEFHANTKVEGARSWQEGLAFKLEGIKEKALPTNEYIKLKREQNQLFKSIRQTGEPELVGRFLEIEDILENSRTHFYTLNELKAALKYLGHDGYEASTIVARQNAYVNMAERLMEARISYLVELSKEPFDGTFQYLVHPSVRVFHPEDWIAEEIYDAEKCIRLAPKAFSFDCGGRKLNLPSTPYPLSFSF